MGTDASWSFSASQRLTKARYWLAAGAGRQKVSRTASRNRNPATQHATSDAKASGGVFVHAWLPLGGPANIGIHARASLDGLGDGNSQLALSLGLGVSTN